MSFLKFFPCFFDLLSKARLTKKTESWPPKTRDLQILRLRISQNRQNSLTMHRGIFPKFVVFGKKSISWCWIKCAVEKSFSVMISIFFCQTYLREKVEKTRKKLQKWHFLWGFSLVKMQKLAFSGIMLFLAFL